MLQFITHPCEKYTIVQEARMAIDGGCRWIQLRMKDATDEQVRQVALELIPMCQESDTFLIIDDRVDVVNDLKVSGVHLGKEDMPPAKARELLGPHAVIGVTANTAEEVLAFRGVDIDYVGVGPCHDTRTKAKLAPIIGVDGYRDIVDKVRAAGYEIPIVAVGGITLADVEPLMQAGVSGLAVSGDIIRADNPVERTSSYIDAFNSIIDNK